MILYLFFAPKSIADVVESVFPAVPGAQMTLINEKLIDLSAFFV